MLEAEGATVDAVVGGGVGRTVLDERVERRGGVVIVGEERRWNEETAGERAVIEATWCWRVVDGG